MDQIKPTTKLKKPRTLKLFSFLCEIADSGSLDVIAYDLRSARRAVEKKCGERFLDYLPGGALYSPSDYGYTVVYSGMVVSS